MLLRLFHQVQDLLGRHQAHGPVRHLAALEHQQGGDALDAVLQSQVPVFVHVHLDDLQLRVLAGGLTLHGTVLSRRVPGGELVWYVLAILVGIAYLLLTVGAPDIGPFADPAAAAMGTIPF